MIRTLSRIALALGIVASAFVASQASYNFALQRGWVGGPAARAATVVWPGPQMESLPVTLPVWPAAPERRAAPRWAPVTAGRLVPTPEMAAPPDAAPALRTALWIDGTTGPVDSGSVALPSGSRFAVHISGGQPGTVEIRTVNPEGRASAGALWRGSLMPGAETVTPALRLAGTRGLETLRVVHRPYGTGPATEQDVQIWHE